MEKKIRVALVDDKAAFRRGMGAVLQLTHNLDCCGVFGAGEEVIPDLVALKPDVVLMDLNLPGVSGIECTRELKKRAPSIQIVMLTIEEDTSKVFAALRAGASGYLLKTANPNEILAAIELVAAGGSPMSASIARCVVESFHGAPEPSPQLESLSPREKQVLELISQGRRHKEVAAELNLSVATVQTYLRRIYEKLQVRSQSEAVARLFR